MKAVVTSQGPNSDSEIDERFGRCRYLLFFDTATGECVAHENTQNLDAAQGAGIQTAAAVSRLGAEYAITGHCGPKAFDVLKAANIQVIIDAKGKANEVIELLKAGKLKPTAIADVSSHW